MITDSFTRIYSQYSKVFSRYI